MSRPPGTNSLEPIARKWRVGPPTSGVAGSLYDFVRRYLCAHEGRCTRDELFKALMSNSACRERLSRSRGYAALLSNMRHSGDVTLEGEIVKATSRTLRRLGLLDR